MITDRSKIIPTFTYEMLLELVSNAANLDQTIPVTLLAAIALRESGGDPLASNTNADGSIDRGLWQINSIHAAEHPDIADFRAACYTPDLNAKLAIIIYLQQGIQAWSSYNSLP